MTIKVIEWFRRMRGAGRDGAGGGGPRGTAIQDGMVNVLLEPPVTQADVESFYAKLDAAELNVPVALIAEWKLMSVEKMAAVKSAEEFAFEQGRLAAFGEIEQMFLELAKREQ